MNRHAKDLYLDLLKDAIDFSKDPKFMYYKSMTTAHAMRMIIELMEERQLYRYEDRLFVRNRDRLCYIFLNKSNGYTNVGTIHEVFENMEEEIVKETVRVELPFSPKWICGGQYKSGYLKRMSDYFELNQVISSLVA
jgi:hypothetical protein